MNALSAGSVAGSAGMFQRAACANWRPAGSRSQRLPAGLSSMSARPLMTSCPSSLLATARRQRLREAQPLVAIVVAVAEEMLADDDAQLRADRARERHRAERQQRGEHQRDLQRAPPVAAEVADVVAGGRHEQQIDASHHAARSSETPRAATARTPNVQSRLRIVDTATSGMTSAWTKPRTLHASASTRLKSSASANR